MTRGRTFCVGAVYNFCQIEGHTVIKARLGPYSPPHAANLRAFWIIASMDPNRHEHDRSEHSAFPLGDSTVLAYKASASSSRVLTATSGTSEPARVHGAHHELVKAEPTAHLGGDPDAFDAIVAAEVLIYFGTARGSAWVPHIAHSGPGVSSFFKVEGAQLPRSRWVPAESPRPRQPYRFLPPARSPGGRFGIFAIQTTALGTEFGELVAQELTGMTSGQSAGLER